MGVKIHRSRSENDEIVSMSVVHEGTQVLTVSENGYGKRTPVEEYRVQSRGGKGIKAMQLTDKTGLLAALMLVREEEDVMMISDDGTIIRTAVADISTQSRSTQGVRMMRLAGDSHVVGRHRHRARRRRGRSVRSRRRNHGADGRKLAGHGPRRRKFRKSAGETEE